MLVCDFCAHPSLMEIAVCRCNHTFCDSCANVSCDEPEFSSCTLCPQCAVECKPPTKPEPPSEFFCPVTHDLMKDPVILSDGFTYERTTAERWLSQKLTSPMTGVPVLSTITPNRVLRGMINDWKEKNNVKEDE
jgi:hypothetical protein